MIDAPANPTEGKGSGLTAAKDAYDSPLEERTALVAEFDRVVAALVSDVQTIPAEPRLRQFKVTR